MFESLDSPTTIFEVAPNSAGGETIWIYEIDDPGDFFEGCENEEKALERLINSDRSPDEQLDTSGYTLVLDSPEDPPVSRSGGPPEKSIVVEVLETHGNDQTHEFYEVENPVEAFGASWGNTTEMLRELQEDGISPMLEYDNVSLIFQRPYGSL